MSDRPHALEWLKRFVPEEQRTDPEAVRRTQLTVAISFFLAATAPVFGAVAFFVYHLPAIAAIDLAGAALAAASPFVLRATRSLLLASSLTLGVIVLTICLAAGSVEGLTSPALAWLAVVPILSSAIAGRRVAAVWAVVCTLGIITMVTLDHFGLMPNRELPPDARRLASAWNFSLMFGVVLFFSALYETLHVRAMAALNETRKELEKARDQAALNERLAALGRLAAGVAHEINNPSTFVAGNVRLARDTVALVRTGAVPATELQEVEMALSDALTGATRITETVRDLKTLGRAGDDKPAVVDAAEVMDVSLRIVANQLRHSATVRRNLAHVPAVVANESRLGQVFVNLLTNAADAMPKRALHENVITVSTRLEGERVCIEVQDNGMGIAAEALPHIFDPFFSTRQAGAGSGLGLSICRNLVAQMKGQLEVQSVVGKGTTFRVLLPAVRETSQRRLRVLVIDDDILMCKSLERLLGRKYDVEHHQSAKEALSRKDLESFDVILCDLMMPELTGVDFYDRVVATLPQVASRIGFMTGGNAAPPEPLRDRLVDKPFEGDKLEALLTLLSGRTGRA
jgi:signal transduction histidine kinase